MAHSFAFNGKAKQGKICPMMQALYVDTLAENFGGCQLREGAMPKASGENGAHVVVKIRAAAIGFPDLLMTHGGYQHKPPLPFIPGTEMAGDVVAVGADCDGTIKEGDSVVCTYRSGGLAQYISLPYGMVRKKPPNLSYAEAAATQSAYLTAYVALVRRAHICADEWLLVHGAGGGVGLAAVDLGRYLGARVIAATPSAEKLAKIQELYAPTALINSTGGFREEVKALTSGGADVIYDPVGGDIFDESVRCIGWGGRLLVIGFTSGRIPAITANMPLIKGFSVVGVRAGEYGRRHPQKGQENLDIVWQLAADGHIRPHVHDILPLSAWRQAFALMQSRRLMGRVIIDPTLEA